MTAISGQIGIGDANLKPTEIKSALPITNHKSQIRLLEYQSPIAQTRHMAWQSVTIGTYSTYPVRSHVPGIPSPAKRALAAAPRDKKRRPISAVAAACQSVRRSAQVEAVSAVCCAATEASRRGARAPSGLWPVETASRRCRMACAVGPRRGQDRG